jgi:putative nucleotidyltransferase with HDIG domain
MSILKAIDKPLFKTISSLGKELKLPLFIVGGWVRDQLLKRVSKDIDFLIIGDGLEFAEALGKKLGGSKVSLFKTYGTASIRYNDFDLEFVGARKESYSEDSRNPSIELGTFEDDIERRDFTINAIAISLNENNYGELLDRFDGLSDLQDKVIRTPLNADITYSDDPLRMMRAIRFATQLAFTIEEDSFNSIATNADRIKIISSERISTELNKVILSNKPSYGFKLLEQSGLLKIIFPEMIDLKGVEKKNGISHKDNFLHTLQVLDNIAKTTDDLWLRWAAILHDIAKPATKRFDPKIGWTFHGHEDKGARMVPKIFKRLKLPLDQKMKFVQKMVFLHLRPIALTKDEATDSALRRLLFETGEDIDKLMLLCKADITSKNETKVKKYLKNYEKVKVRLVEVEEKDHLRNWQPPISGEQIMDTFNLKPSREVGLIKNAIREAILDGIMENNFEEAFQFMLKKGKELGLTRAEI